MAAYFIAQMTITDPEGYKAYASQTLPTIQKYGGKFVVRGGAITPVEGDFEHERVVVLEFPDVEAAQRWYNSPEYQPLALQRQAASKGKSIIVEGAPPQV